MLKNRGIGDVLASTLGTRGDTRKWMVPFDSAHPIRVSTFSREVLTVKQGVCRWRFKIAKSVLFLIIDEEPDDIRVKIWQIQIYCIR